VLADLTPAVLDLKLYAGDEAAVVINVVDRSTKMAIDLSDRTWTSQWRRKRSSLTAVELSVDATDAATGTLIVHFPDDLDPCGVWDLEGTHAVTGKDTIITGDVTVEMDVTRP
jgi:hypothetical protein